MSAFAALISSTILVFPSDRHDPFITLSPSRPHRKTGRSYSSAQVLATNPSSDGLQSGLPMTITAGIGDFALPPSSFCLSRSVPIFPNLVCNIFFTSFTSEATTPFLSLFILSRCLTDEYASSSLSADNILNASSGSPIREAAFILGVTINAISSSVK